jgi:hypothetical protein
MARLDDVVKEDGVYSCEVAAALQVRTRRIFGTEIDLFNCCDRARLFDVATRIYSEHGTHRSKNPSTSLDSSSLSSISHLSQRLIGTRDDGDHGGMTNSNLRTFLTQVHNVVRCQRASQPSRNRSG